MQNELLDLHLAVEALHVVLAIALSARYTRDRDLLTSIIDW